MRAPLKLAAAATALICVGALAFFVINRPPSTGRHVVPRANPLAVPAPSPYPLDRADNGLWLSRHWLYEQPTDAEITRLAASLERLGIKRIYPFLGPPDESGVPGWREGGVHHPYELARARHFIEALKRQAPQVMVLPWTGGLLSRDVVWSNEKRLDAWLGELRALLDAGADGVHFNIEPVPDGDPGLIALLTRARKTFGLGAHVSVAVPLFRIDSYGLPQKARLWSRESLDAVCQHADEVTVMAYDTYQTEPNDYQRTMTDWANGLETVRGCEVLIGVPSYEDDAAHHRPEVERLDVALRGVLASHAPWPENLRGVAVYGGWTTDENEWEVFQALWRGKAPVRGPLPEE